MAEKKETTKKSKSKKKGTKSTTKKKSTKKKETKKKKKDGVKETVEKVMESSKKESPVKRKKRDLNEMICVVNITNSSLVYVSKSVPGYRIDWDGYLDENWIEYKELVNMRNSQRTFFKEPWIMCDWDVLEDLKVNNYYKNIINLENLDKLFEKHPSELEKILEVIPKGIKKLVVDRAFELRREDKLDSLKIIKVIEDNLKVDLSI